jgi:hypothetical protein
VGRWARGGGDEEAEHGQIRIPKKRSVIEKALITIKNQLYIIVFPGVAQDTPSQWHPFLASVAMQQGDEC